MKALAFPSRNLIDKTGKGSRVGSGGLASAIGMNWGELLLIFGGWTVLARTVPLLVPSCLPLSRAGWGSGMISLVGQHPAPWLLDACLCLPRRTILTGISLRPSLPSSQHQAAFPFLPSVPTWKSCLSLGLLWSCSSLWSFLAAKQ